MLDRIKAGRTDLVFEYVAAGGAATAATGTAAHSVSLLQWAAYYGDVSAIRFLIGHGARLPELGDDLGLIGAAFHGHWRLVEFLLEQGADPNSARADTGETPLHRAAAFGSEETIARLLAVGARREEPDAAGDTPLSWASWHTRPDAILRLLCHGSFQIHPERRSTFDHGGGFGELERALLGRPQR